MIVVDASAVIEVLLRGPAASAIERRLFGNGHSLHAPHLLDVEVTQVLRRFALKGDITAKRGQEAIEDLGALPLRRYPHEALLGRVWRLRDTVTAYDAVYVALAEALPARLVTRDSRLANASGVKAQIEVF